MLFGQKQLKTNFVQLALLPMTLKTTPKIISRLLLAMQKVLANLKF